MIEVGRLAEFLSKIVLNGQSGIFHPQDKELTLVT